MNGFDFSSFPVTVSLLFANLVLSGYVLTTAGQMAVFSLNVGRVLSFKEYYRIVTSGFVHVDPFHFLFNMMTLYFFGPTLERFLGSFGFAMVYFGSLLGGSFLALYMKRNQPEYSAVGASGAISGVILSFCLFWPMAKIYIFFIPLGIPAFLFGGLFILISIYFMDQPGGTSRSLIGHEAHLGGALSGMLITILLEPRAIDHFLRYFS